MLSRYFSLTAWGPFLSLSDGYVQFAQLSADWREASTFDGETFGGSYSITAGLLGFCATLTYWPQGKG